MSEPINTVHREGDWVVLTDYNMDFDTVDVRIGRRTLGGTIYMKSDGGEELVASGAFLPPEPTIRFARTALTALANALRNADPVSESAVGALSDALKLEQGRVDKLIDFAVRSATD